MFLKYVCAGGLRPRIPAESARFRLQRGRPVGQGGAALARPACRGKLRHELKLQRHFPPSPADVPGLERGLVFPGGTAAWELRAEERSGEGWTEATLWRQLHPSARLPAFIPLVPGRLPALPVPHSDFRPSVQRAAGSLISSVNMYYSLGILSNRVHRVITERIVHYLHISYGKGYLCNYRM